MVGPTSDSAFSDPYELVTVKQLGEKYDNFIVNLDVVEGET